jgi:streptogramin lyase
MLLEAAMARLRRSSLSDVGALRLAACLAASGLLPGGLVHAQPVEYPLPVQGLPAGIVAGPDGAVWFTDWAGKVGRITTSGSITSFPVSGGVGQSDSITVGSDGNLWFAGGNGISRMTTSGTVTTFVPPTPSSSPRTIVSGPDGALWFTESAGNKIGRVTTAGVFTEYPIPTVSADPYGIAVGSDGALWFTEKANKVGRITTAGAITEFPIAGNMSYSSAIAAGADGNLWFTENPGNKIGRITTAGVLTEFPLATTTRAFGISPGSDGNLWFTEFDGNRIGCITPSGVVTEYFIPTADSGPYGITSGPDGNLWFTEFNGSKIGRVKPPTPPPAALLYTLTPCRVMDTRNPAGPLGGPALAANTTRLFTVAGKLRHPLDRARPGGQHCGHRHNGAGTPSRFPRRSCSSPRLDDQLRSESDAGEQRRCRVGSRHSRDLLWPGLGNDSRHPRREWLLPIRAVYGAK